MGSKIELLRIAVYVFFPVGVFYLFNLPDFYNDYVAANKNTIYPPVEETHNDLPFTKEGILKLRRELMEKKLEGGTEEGA